MATLIKVYKGEELIAEETFIDIVSRVGDEKLVTLELLKNGGKVNLDNIFKETRMFQEGVIMKPGNKGNIFPIKLKRK